MYHKRLDLKNDQLKMDKCGSLLIKPLTIVACDTHTNILIKMTTIIVRIECSILIWLSIGSEDHGSLRQDRILNLHDRIRDVHRGIMPVLPAGPCHKLLVRLLKEVEEEFCGHVLIQDALKENRKTPNQSIAIQHIVQ